MQFALAEDGYRITAEHGRKATCPQCGCQMVPKCGQIIVHHWAHESTQDCDPWWEPESEWHRFWKNLMPEDSVEVTIGNHRADIVRFNNIVVELQHSPISVDEIAEREAAYGKMVWLFDGRDIRDDNLLFRDHGAYVSFRWKHPRKHYGACQKPVFIDLGKSIFQLNRLYSDGPPYGGYGFFKERGWFKNWLTESKPKFNGVKPLHTTPLPTHPTHFVIGGKPGSDGLFHLDQV